MQNARWALKPVAALRAFAYPCHLELAILRAIQRTEEEAVQGEESEQRPPRHDIGTHVVCTSMKEGKNPSLRRK